MAEPMCARCGLELLADDHALIAAALCRGAARWRSFLATPNRGEVCVGGVRYSSTLDRFGVPQLHELLRRDLRKAMGQHQ